jgi:P27 family predicted phage terminase small subunit
LPSDLPRTLKSTLDDAMSNPPVPLRLKVLRGNPGKRRLNTKEPQPRRAAACPEPPSWLSEYAAAHWRRIAPELWAAGLLTVLDETMLAVLCTSYGRWHDAEELLAAEELVVPGSNKNRVPNPLLRIAIEAARDVCTYSREFGLTPSARVRVRAEMPEDHGKFRGLLAGIDDDAG